MLPRSEFLPQQQFHLLIDFANDERSVAVLPNGNNGAFLVVDQGEILGQLDFDKQLNCVSAQCEVDPGILAQLDTGIRNHYS
ncbi:MAG TPA: hypothetical protein VHE59_15925 [Mucilaginibacter sp.]|nr:hypothetical protein [Mucilaginibacter sp.]